MTYHDIGVALGLSAGAMQDAYALARECERRFGARRFFLAPPFLPHVTLYQGRFVYGAIDRKTLGELAARIVYRGCWSGEPLALASSLRVTEDGWIFWEAERTRSLRDFHEEVAGFLQRRASANFREKARAILLDRTIDRLTRKRVRRFGGIHTGEKFCPHITIGQVLLAREDNARIGFPARHLLRVIYPTKLIVGDIDGYGRMDSRKVFWEKSLRELERPAIVAQ